MGDPQQLHFRDCEFLAPLEIVSIRTGLKYIEFINDRREKFRGYTSSDDPNILTGPGQMILPLGIRYKGHFKNNELHGYGEMEDFVKNMKYKGDFKDAICHGYGITIWNRSRTRYEGWGKNGMRHGFGFQTLPNGGYQKGQWKYDKLDGFGEQVNPPGIRYEGMFERGEMHGIGIKQETQDSEPRQGQFERGNFIQQI